MTTSINTNISAFFGQNNLRSAAADAQSSIARLSSGNAIIRASDDVAGLSVGTILRTDVSTLRTALSNTAQAGSLIQVADGAIERLGEILQRQASLSVQGNADTLSDNERGFLDQEFQALTQEFDRIVSTTNFNGVNLLDGNLEGTPVAENATPIASDFVFDLAGSTDITAATVTGLGSDEALGITNITSFSEGLATATVAALASPATEADFTFTPGAGTSAAEVTTLGTDSGVITDANLAAATVALVDGDGTATDATLTVTIGGVDFVSPAEGFDPDAAGDIALTSAGGTVLTINFDDFNETDADSAAAVTAVTDAVQALTVVNAGDNGEGELTITSGGVAFVSAADADFSAGPVTLTSAANGETITIDLSGQTITSDAELTAAAAAAQADLQSSFLDNNAATVRVGAASFQVGTASSDTISVDISDLSSQSVGLRGLSVDTRDNATAASNALSAAIDTVTGARASIGAIQSRFDFASATLETSVQNLDAARGGFLDADISSVSTEFAQQQVLIQASISVLAQANQLPQNLLKLIG